jgi:tetratricopeptide (TPR) repeat protein
VIDLCEHAMDEAESALGYVDDSDGHMSLIAERLHELHRDACGAAQPDPVVLAGTLFDRELHSGDLDFFFGAASSYAEVLGEEGLSEYRRLAQAEWDASPPLGPQDSRSWSGTRHRITRIMQTLAELSGDVDAIVEVLARDQSSAYQFVQIAAVLVEAERYDDALAWAEKGLASHGTSDSRLVSTLAEEYHRAGRGEDAVRICWDAYEQRPSLATYQQLSQQAQRAGSWPAWHGKALDLLRTRIGQGQRKPGRERGMRWSASGPDRSTLVEVLLFDEDVEQAWAVASTAGCRRDLWLELARRREGEHPLDAIPIWKDEIERQIDLKKNPAYAEAVRLIARVGSQMKAAGHDEDFRPYVTKLRATHKPKRNLMKLFAERDW